MMTMKIRELKFRRWSNVDKKFEWFWLASHSILTTLKIPSRGTWDKLEYWQQYSFIDDINGSEIYEGDILSEKWKAEVLQNDEGTFMVRFNNNPDVNRPMSLKKYLKHMEKAGTSYINNIIVGNIYENPDLLNED